MSQARSRLERVGGDRLIAALRRQSWLRSAVGRRAITFLGALFIFLANLLAYSMFSGSSPLLDIFIAYGLSAVPGAVLVYRSYQLPSTDIDPRFHAVVGTWCYGSAIVTAGALTLYHVQPAAELAQPARIILNLASMGAIAGYAIGFHDARSRTRATDLEEYQRVVEAVDDGVYVLDEDDRFRRVNDGFVSMTAFERSELLGAHASVVFGAKFEEIDAQDRRQFESGGTDVVAFEEEIYTDDESITVESRFQRFALENGTGRVGVVRDVTERKEREQQLEQFERMVETVNDGVYATDGDGQFLFVNDAFVSMSQNTRAELLGAHGSVFFGERFVETDEEEWRELIEGERDSVEFETEIIGQNGDVRVVHNRFVLLDFDDVTGRVGVTRDITELKEYQRKLEESNERLEQFAHVASHDLQEPLRMVSSYVQLLEDRYADELDADAEAFIDYAVEGAERMRAMINALLAYSRVNSEAAPLEPTDAEAVVERVLRDLELPIEETDAEIDVGSLPTVDADANQLGQVFQNLVSNAIKYRGEEPPEIEISADRDGEEWVFRVTDNGIGIDPEHADRIFDVFDRLHTDEEYSGTGIGLALCEKIIDRHDGDIWVESVPGEGSTFSFTIPATDDASDEEDRRDGRTRQVLPTDG